MFLSVNVAFRSTWSDSDDSKWALLLFFAVLLLVTMDEATVGNASSSRKRSRTSTSSTGGTRLLTGAAARSHQQESADDKIRAAQLRDPKQRIKALNAILKLSSSHEDNYALTGNSVIQGLVHIAVDCMKWNAAGESEVEASQPDASQSKSPESSNATSAICTLESSQNAVFHATECWMTPPTKEMQEWAKHWKHTFLSEDSQEMYPMLEVVTAILRNLSFVGANLRMLAYTPGIVSVLIGCLYENHNDCGAAAAASERAGSHKHSQSSSSSAYETASDIATKRAQSRINVTVNALQTLIHLSPYLDVTGQKLLADRLFYTSAIKDGPRVPDMHQFGQAADGAWGFGGMWLAKRLDVKEDVMAASVATKDFVTAFCADYLAAVWSLFAALQHVLSNPKCPRPVILVAVDLLQELCSQARVGLIGPVEREKDIPNLRAILVSAPDSVLERLVDLLYIPRLGPDALEYLDPCENIVTRVTTLKLLLGYDATVDTDVRDRSLEVLTPLLEMDSPSMAARLGRETPGGAVRVRLWDSLVPALTSTAGRSEATVLAAQVFRELRKAPENEIAFLYVQERLVEMASKDTRVAHLVWNFLYPPTAVETEEESDANENNAHMDDESEAKTEG